MKVSACSLLPIPSGTGRVEDVGPSLSCPLSPRLLTIEEHARPIPPGTYIFIRRLVGADQVRVEAREPDDGPDGEEAYHGLQHGDLESRT